MEREIKFRAWISDEMVILPNTGVQYFDFEGSYALSFVVDGYAGFWGHEQYETATKKYCKDAPIMQYIGLKDKNGVEIYEGDIIENDGISIVKYRGNSFGAESPGSRAHDFVSSHFFETGEVVGNIYQNPELI